MRPFADDVRTTFLRHHKHSVGQDGETVLRELNSEKSTAVSYSGRTIFELVQNALDRSERHVLVAILPSSPPILVVGNDGPGVGVDPAFDYNPSEFSERGRSDFHALCSLHTSNKTADESIGNKGVGFRSVFSLGGQVRVWSRLRDDDGWWGVEMHVGFTGAIVQRRAREDEAVRAGLEWVGAEHLPALGDKRPRPSFYFPIPLRTDSLPVDLAEATDCETLVVVPLTAENARTQVTATLQELRDTHLYFVGLRGGKQGLMVTVLDEQGGREQIPVGWVPDDAEVALVASWRTPEEEAGRGRLAVWALEARHAVSRPSVAVAWPRPPRDDATKNWPALLYGYLPTRIDSPFGIDIHADFQLEANRTSLNTSDKDPVGRYNAALLEAAAELHLVVVLRHAGFSDEEIDAFPHDGFRHIGSGASCVVPVPVHRCDLFSMLRPKEPPKFHAFTNHMERLLFGEQYGWNEMGCYERWAQLAARALGVDVGEGTERMAYDAFWEASAAWLQRAGETRKVAFGRRRQFLEACTVALGDALRRIRARVVPLLDDGNAPPSTRVARSFPVAERRERGEGGGRLERRLFVRVVEEEQTGELHLPQVVVARGRAVTSYPVEGFFSWPVEKALGLTAFGRWELLVDLRQLPSRLDGWVSSGEIAPDEQLGLLRFVAELFSAKLRSSDAPQADGARYGWGWRAETESLPDLQSRAGRALATLFLRTMDERFEPARQLDFERVDRAWLSPLTDWVPNLDLDAFLLFLGVAPVPGLLLVEEGAAGVVAPCAAPPALIDAEGASGPLDLVVRQSTETLQACLLQSWPSLKPVIDAERMGRRHTNIGGWLGSLPWISVQTEGFQLPHGIADQPTHVAPRDLVLVHRIDRRRSVVFSLETGEGPLRDLLESVGAVIGFDDRELERDGARAALHLLAQLQRLDLEKIAKHLGARQALIELFQNILDAIARHAPLDTEPPLLSYVAADAELSLAERRMAWVEQDAPAFILKDNSDREWARRFFYSEPLVTATLGREVVARLPVLRKRAAEIDSVVHCEVGLSAQAPEALRARLDRLLPGLLALAEVSRQLLGGVKLDEAARNWSQQRIERVANVWYEIELQARGKILRCDWLKDTRGDVVLNGSRILFDVEQPDDSHPPLRSFAEVLAASVVGNPIVAGTFAVALAEFDVALDTADDENGIRRFRAHLQKHGALRLAETFERELRPLDLAEQERLREGVSTALGALGLGLAPSLVQTATLPATLGVGDLVPRGDGFGDVTEDNVCRALADAAVPNHMTVFLPGFSCRSRQQEAWRVWLGDGRRQERLFALAEQLLQSSVAGEAAVTSAKQSVRHGDWRRQLDEVAHEFFPRLSFSPAAVAHAWLVSQLGASSVTFTASQLEQQLPELAQYSDVVTLVGSKDCTWTVHPIGPAREQKKEIAPQTPDERRDEDEHKADIGADAETALLAWVVRTTSEILRARGDAAWSVLESVANPGTKLAAALANARGSLQRTERLGAALHVSKFNGAAGYDLIGLELDGSNLPVVTRYECKALPTGRRAQVHLSRNEVNVFRRCAAQPHAGRWKLIGVHRDGTAVELTHHLTPVLDEKEGPLVELAGKGIGFDAITLTIEQADVGSASLL